MHNYPECLLNEGFHLGIPLYIESKAQLLCGSPVVFESMGNRPVPFQHLSEEPSPPLKAGYRDTYSTSVEMESLSELNEDNKWKKTYTQCGIRAKRPTYWRFKPRTNFLFCCLIGIILAVVIILLL